jgi:hypothetical protein
MTKKQVSAKSAKSQAAPNATPASPGDHPAKKETKSAAIIELLKKPDGATLEQMMEATGWQKHSVRGFLAGTLKKKHGLAAVSTKVDGTRMYKIDTAGQA